MCDHSHSCQHSSAHTRKVDAPCRRVSPLSPKPSSLSRRTFLRQIVAGAIGGAILSGRAKASAEVRGSRVGWARLVTPNPYWTIHQEQDRILASFIRDETGMNIDPIGYVVHPSNLKELCAFPLIFTNSITPIVDPAERGNLREYVRRGGFFYIDGCVEWKVTPDFEKFFRDHAAFFSDLFPGSKLTLLPETDPVFRSYFPVDEASTRNGGGERGHWGSIAEGLYGVFDGDRMISLVSLDHLQCGWPNDRERMGNCIKEIANIYVCAMTRP